MATHQHQAIIIKISDWGVKDRIITFLTADRGKMRAMNYNAKSQTNRHNSSLQLFNTVEAELDYARSLPTIKQVDCINSRRELREDFDRLQYSAFIAELVDALYHEQDNDSQLFPLLTSCFALLLQRNSRIAALVSALHIIGHAGYKPYLDHCLRCNAKITERLHFDFDRGGSLCDKCSPAQLPPLAMDAVALLAQLQSLPLDANHSFSVGKRSLDIAERIFYSYITHHINHNFKTLSFINAIIIDE
ncbi:MAG: DNA repair protein RecO [Negativicutes bacterium]|jgi:DNA repair protein RecO (recombination protein O)